MGTLGLREMDLPWGVFEPKRSDCSASCFRATQLSLSSPAWAPLCLAQSLLPPCLVLAHWDRQQIALTASHELTAVVIRPSWPKRLVLLVGIQEDVGKAGLPGVPRQQEGGFNRAFVLWAWPGFRPGGAGVAAAWFIGAWCPLPPSELSACPFYLPRVISINLFSLCVRACFQITPRRG